jgi:hypothetical protein
VQPPAVVDLVDEAGQVEGDVLDGLAGDRIDRLDLQRLDEALGLGVVVGVAAPPHRTDQAVPCNRRWNGTPDWSAIGTPWPGPDGLQLDGAGRPRSPSGGARAGSERAPSTLASGRRGRDLWTPGVGPAVG